ncbi:archaea-specific SMC-related protein [Halomarina rubra]|uniref:Archaea-specific SMC-related protein n=1 Tax=Halomarina rubra TaxID=2071873 RepID=A0ABD6AXP9_9EURY|nr:archaea-specific SMC-related protein [Halomarina rubra]
MTTLEISISNVGGIDTLETSFESGTSIVAAPNASNKTSLLKAIAFGIGADDVPVRSGASTAEVTLTIGEKSVTRTAKRHGVGTRLSGTPWLDDEEVRAQFSTVAALLEFNDLRTAVRSDGDVESVLKSPIDFDGLENRRATLLEEKRSMSRERETLADADERLDDALEERAAARERQSDLEERLAELEREREPTTGDERSEALRDRRTELRNERDQLRERIDATEAAIERYEDERATLEEDIDRLRADHEATDLQALREERSELQSELERLRDRVDILQSVLTANREMQHSDFAGVLGSHHGLDGDEVTCWTCGQAASVEAIEETLDDLQSLVADSKAEVRSRQPAVEEVDEALQAARRTESELDRLRAERRSLDERIAERETSLETQRDRLEALQTDLTDVTEELDELHRERADTDADIADAIEDARVDHQTLDRELDRLDTAVENRRADVERRDELDDRLDDLSEEIRSVTERIETMEQRLRAQFNDAMDDLLAALDFDRVQRVWLDGEFDIVVARDVDGTVQQDSVGNLAESERELIGLVLGLAGYLAYDLAERVPVLLLDSLGALDNERVARLVEYFRDGPEFLVAAVHPDTADALDRDQIDLLRSPTLR